MASSSVQSNSISPVDATNVVKRLGRQSGFDLVRVTDSKELHEEKQRHLEWIRAGRQGEMQWMTAARAERSSQASSLLTGARSVISVALAYWSGHRPKSGQNEGKVARYAWGADYHSVLAERLEEFARTLETELGGEHKWYVDTGPLMDKAFAARSGVGFYGKNTNILTERFGSFVFLGEILTTLHLQPDAALERDCGSCRLCVVACPTGALGPDYSIDSTKCISYLTIEHRSAIPKDLREKVGNWVFGCDICQDVCPPTMQPHLSSREERDAWIREIRFYTSKSTSETSASDQTLGGRVASSNDTAGDRLEAQGPNEDGKRNPLFEQRKEPAVDLVGLLRLTHEQYLDRFRGTAIRRAKAWMLRRNAAVALGNTGTEDAIEPLRCALESDEHPIVRSHAAWALGKLGSRLSTRETTRHLTSALANEQDPEVRSEIEEALPRGS